MSFNIITCFGLLLDINLSKFTPLSMTLCYFIYFLPATQQRSPLYLVWASHAALQSTVSTQELHYLSSYRFLAWYSRPTAASVCFFGHLLRWLQFSARSPPFRTDWQYIKKYIVKLPNHKEVTIVQKKTIFCKSAIKTYRTRIQAVSTYQILHLFLCVVKTILLIVIIQNTVDILGNRPTRMSNTRTSPFQPFKLICKILSSAKSK